ncbi:hypothetical protein LOTGIDRAFT_169235 [Lottia gigantea]|uniref:Uncharacterized protein n=1 Tax=Lottia gigantea TaxID=225164 RepID=V3ZH89_LOTGI|nr:hypothetical protein LOTGIDRAFT_169235 [Lottia gigantea]ESO83542.1 hypothetical protein LOTGIDRAFT_169235 [Lottia gigantea]
MSTLQQVTGIRGSNSAKTRITRRIKDNGNNKVSNSELTGLENREDSFDEYGHLSPVEDESLENKPEKLDTTDIQMKLYKRECGKLGVIPIGAFMRNPCSSELIVKHYSMGPNGAKALSIPLMLDSSLVHLDLEGNDIQDKGLAGLSEMLLESVTVKFVNLSKNNLGHKSISNVQSLLQKNRFIESIYLADNGFSDVDASAFSEILKENKTLKKLVLSNNDFGDESGLVFGNALAINETLEYLDLSWNKFRGKSAADLLKGIKENVSLKYFNLSYNGCGKTGAIEIASTLVTNSTLVELDLTDNRLTDIDVQIIVFQLDKNESLQKLRLGDNLITANGCLELIKKLKTMENLTLKELDLKNTNVNQEFLNEIEEYMKLENPMPEIKYGICPTKRDFL